MSHVIVQACPVSGGHAGTQAPAFSCATCSWTWPEQGHSSPVLETGPTASLLYTCDYVALVKAWGTVASVPATGENGSGLQLDSCAPGHCCLFCGPGDCASSRTVLSLLSHIQPPVLLDSNRRWERLVAQAPASGDFICPVVDPSSIQGLGKCALTGPHTFFTVSAYFPPFFSLSSSLSPWRQCIHTVGPLPCPPGWVLGTSWWWQQFMPSRRQRYQMISVCSDPHAHPWEWSLIPFS